MTNQRNDVDKRQCEKYTFTIFASVLFLGSAPLCYSIFHRYILAWRAKKKPLWLLSRVARVAAYFTIIPLGYFYSFSCTWPEYTTSIQECLHCMSSETDFCRYVMTLDMQVPICNRCTQMSFQSIFSSCILHSFLQREYFSDREFESLEAELSNTE